MISVIICSANEQDLSKVKVNIAQTIGIPFEIIAIDNSEGKMGICEVYNRGAAQAQYGILCFMHEDIEMITPMWGNKVTELFDQNPKVGLIGVAGGGYKSLVPSSWYNADLEVNGGFYCSLIQGFKHSGETEFFDYRNPKDEKLSHVACIDGCWMCTKKSIVLEYPFDQGLLTKFHGYDLDFSLAVNQKYKVAVTYEIVLRHFSEGNFDSEWFEATLKVHKKWSWILPVNTDGLNEATLSRYERRAFKVFANNLLDQGFTYSQLATIGSHFRHSRIFPRFRYLKIYLDLWKLRKKREKNL